MPNGDKAIGVVQHCPDASVLLVTGERETKSTKVVHFHLVRYDAGGAQPPSGQSIAVWQQDMGQVSIKPEVTIEGNTVTGVRVHQNGHRETTKKTVNNCRVQ